MSNSDQQLSYHHLMFIVCEMLLVLLMISNICPGVCFVVRIVYTKQFSRHGVHRIFRGIFSLCGILQNIACPIRMEKIFRILQIIWRCYGGKILRKSVGTMTHISNFPASICQFFLLEAFEVLLKACGEQKIQQF